VSEVKRLKGAMRGPAASAAAAATPDPVAADQLVAMLRGLGACVSLVHERKHEQLLKELLDVPLWQVPQVRKGHAARGRLAGAGWWVLDGSGRCVRPPCHQGNVILLCIAHQQQPQQTKAKAKTSMKLN
jgi:hypothetical protein